MGLPEAHRELASNCWLPWLAPGSSGQLRAAPGSSWQFLAACCQLAASLLPSFSLAPSVLPDGVRWRFSTFFLLAVQPRRK